MSVLAEARNTPVDSFQKDLLSVCGNFMITPRRGRDHIRGVVEIDHGECLSVALIENDAHTVSRDARCVRRDSAEHLFLVLQQSGSARMRQGEAEACLAPGDFFVIDSAYPSEFLYNGQSSRQISMHLNRADMVRRFGNTDLAGHFISRQSAIAAVLRATIDRIANPVENASSREYISEAFFNLMGAHLCELRQGGTGRSSAAKIAERARALIDREFRNPDCTPASIARMMGVSLRQMQRSFQDLGKAPSQYLIGKRLDYACMRLAERGESAGRKLISTIAYEAGFNDLSYFNRVFREHYGLPPGQYCPLSSSSNRLAQ